MLFEKSPKLGGERREHASEGQFSYFRLVLSKPSKLLEQERSASEDYPEVQRYRL